MPGIAFHGICRGKDCSSGAAICKPGIEPHVQVYLVPGTTLSAWYRLSSQNWSGRAPLDTLPPRLYYGQRTGGVRLDSVKETQSTFSKALLYEK